MKETENRPAKTDKNGNTQNGDDFAAMRETVTEKFPIQSFPSLPDGDDLFLSSQQFDSLPGFQ